MFNDTDILGTIFNRSMAPGPRLGGSDMTELCLIHAYGLECCASCGAHNRYWVSKKGYGEEYITWLETGLCPKYANPKESA